MIFLRPRPIDNQAFDLRESSGVGLVGVGVGISGISSTVALAECRDGRLVYILIVFRFRIIFIEVLYSEFDFHSSIVGLRGQGVELIHNRHEQRSIISHEVSSFMFSIFEEKTFVFSGLPFRV